MRDAKSGEWWKLEPQRALSNNSVAYTETPEVGQFMEEWLSLYGSKSGERGIFNREAAQKHVEKFGRRSATLADGRPIDFGRSEEHTSELQSLMRISYAVFCLKQKKKS